MNRFIIADSQRCIGCGTCMSACSTAHKAVGLQSQPRLRVMRAENATAPVACRHCEDAPCARVCPVNAITREEGQVQLNETVCVGCTLCAIACPFGAIAFNGSRPLDYANSYDTYIPSTVRSSNPSTSSPVIFGKDILAWEPGVKSIAVKCDLCETRDQGPACVEVCPTKAIVLVEEGNMKEAAKSRAEEAAVDVSSVVLEAQG